LGLASRLNTATGGIEKLHKGDESSTSTARKLAITNNVAKTIVPVEARVERDPETGKILHVIHPTSKSNPLNDPLYSDSDSEDEPILDHSEQKSKNEIVALLEEQARGGKEKKDRSQSEREKEWIRNLVEKHGDNYDKMMRDRKLNPMQQTASDIKRRVAKWRESGGEMSGESG
jgi:nucleolar protein 16